MVINYIIVCGGGGEESAERSMSIGIVRRKGLDSLVSNTEIQEGVVTKFLC